MPGLPGGDADGSLAEGGLEVTRVLLDAVVPRPSRLTCGWLGREPPTILAAVTSFVFRLRHVNDAYCALVGLGTRACSWPSARRAVSRSFRGVHFRGSSRVAMTGELCRSEHELHLPAAGASLAARVFHTVIASMGEELLRGVPRGYHGTETGRGGTRRDPTACSSEPSR